MHFYAERQVARTKKACRCGWCCEPIKAGAPSTSTACRYEGSFIANRYHPECNAAIHRWAEHVGECGEELPDDVMKRGGIYRKEDDEDQD